MADITWTNVTDHHPVMADVAAAVQTDILAMVNSMLDTGLFCDGEDDSRLKLCRIHLAAHFAHPTLAGTDPDAAGPVTGRAQGGMSISYASSHMPGSSEYGTTRYGRLYLNLIRGTLARAGLLL